MLSPWKNVNYVSNPKELKSKQELKGEAA